MDRTTLRISLTITVLDVLFGGTAADTALDGEIARNACPTP